ncbi:MAG: hypothetical protein L6V83_00745 [Christensenella sp.]|nr:MAG: hypothetical protein L6V83_00745 [Christensenella sp.]
MTGTNTSARSTNPATYNIGVSFFTAFISTIDNANATKTPSTNATDCVLT